MNTEHIPLVDLAAQHAEVNPELQDDLNRVLTSASFVGGADVECFEAEYATFTGVAHCVGVANGTDAVEMALRAVGVQAGDEVVLPANTFIATAGAVARIGARPVLVDVDPDSLLIDVDQVAAALSTRTRAVIPVHLFGRVAETDRLAEVLEGTDVVVVEDAAQSQGATRHGRRSGALGTVGATSFYPGKNLGAAGDAGAVTTDDPEIARRVRLLGNHGSLMKYVHELVGFNSRLDTLQAVVLRHKLRHLEEWNRARRALADRYTELLREVDGVVTPAEDTAGEPVWHLYVVRVPERDTVLKSLHEQNIGAGVHYPQPVHLTQAFRSLGHAEGDFPVAEAAAQSILSLPMYPHLSEDHQDRVVASLERALAHVLVRPGS
jgi:dTDP-4-amino-4,6-dideoxygalactose transaminase